MSRENDLNILTSRIIDLCYELKLAHIGSCLSCIPTIYDIYKKMTEDDVFILSNGHAAMALYVMIEFKYGLDAKVLWQKYGTHPTRNILDKIFCSTGSLGSGLPIAVGMALVDKTRQFYCTISDGECAEGSIWESLHYITEMDIQNIHVYALLNGYSAYKTVNPDELESRLKVFYKDINIVHTTSEVFPFLRGLLAHYYVMKEQDYKLAKELLA